MRAWLHETREQIRYEKFRPRVSLPANYCTVFVAFLEPEIQLVLVSHPCRLLLNGWGDEKSGIHHALTFPEILGNWEVLWLYPYNCDVITSSYRYIVHIFSDQ